MRRYRWLIILIVVIVAVVVAVGYAIAPTARKVLVSKVEQTTGLKPSVEGVSVSVWRGAATAYGVIIPNPKPFREPNLLKARSITVDLALIPLLSKRVDIQKIAVRGADLTVERDSQGRTNVQVLQERIKGEEKPAAEPQPIRIGKVSVSSSIVRYIENGTASPPAKLVLKDVNATLNNIDSSKAKELLPSPFRAQAVIDTPRPGRLSAEGLTNPFDPLANFDLELVLEQLDLPELQKLHPPKSVTVQEGLADLKTSAKSRKYDLNAHNKLVLRNLDLKPKGTGGQVAGLPMPLVVEFLKKEDVMELEFDVTGDVRDPKANLEPAVEKLVAGAFRDKILASPKAILEVGKMGTGTGTRALETGKKVGEAGAEGVKSLGGGLKKIFGK